MNNILKKNDIIYIVVLLIILNTFILTYIFSKRAELLLLDYTSFKAKNIINSMIDTSIRQVLYNQKYNNLIIDYKDDNNSVVNIDFNNNEINNILYLVNEDILNNITQLEEFNIDSFKTKNISLNKKVFYVPLGIIYNTPVLNNFGPKIPFKIDFIGTLNNETKINVKEYGINSSFIELILNINIQLKVVLPFKSKIIQISKPIILDSKIVQGKVPDYYGGIMSVR